MLESISRLIRVRTHLFLRKVHRTRAMWLRGLLSLAMALAFSWIESGARFDSRFQLRGQQSVRQDIVVVHVEPDFQTHETAFQRRELRSLREMAPFSDAFFWETGPWLELLTKILAAEPAAIGITLFFPSGTLDSNLTPQAQKILTHRRVFWAARLDSDGRAVLPAFTRSYGNNAGLIDFPLDEDRVVRRFSSPTVQIPHLSVRLSEALSPSVALRPTTPSLIFNFAGPSGVFKTYSSRALLEDPDLAAKELKGKVVVIGTQSLDSHQLQTPVGRLNRAELVAQSIDNLLENRWIRRLPYPIVAIYLSLLLIAAIAIVSLYPQGIAVVVLLWIGIASTSISMWVFDTFALWLPILPALVTLVVTYILFLGHQLTVQENLSWRLEQQKTYLEELEQLKNNFVSLFSHDLKTPIAKIQAICDRLLASELSPEVKTGLTSLRHESTELHRYIQSILKVSRLESEGFRIVFEPTDINELIFTVTQQIKPLADAKNVVIDTHLEPLFAIDMDPALIQEVILNLAENAVKYSPPDGHVDISSQELADQVVVTVSDRGPGVAKEEQGKIFEKFYRGSEHSMSTKGSGLGLFLVKYFVELHGGRVFIRSEPGQGSRIGFFLPLEQPQSSEESHALSGT